MSHLKELQGKPSDHGLLVFNLSKNFRLKETTVTNEHKHRLELKPRQHQKVFNFFLNQLP